MHRLTAAALVLLLLSPAVPLRAQGIPVIDVSNYQQLLEMATKTLDMLNTAKLLYELTQRMANGLTLSDAFRIAAVPTFDHDPSRFDFGVPYLNALNIGDPRGDAYRQVVQQLKPPPALLGALPAGVRDDLQKAYAGIEIMDSITQMAGHQSAIVRAYHGKLGGVIQFLENDILSRIPGFNSLTAIMDKITAAQLVSRRSDMAGNQLLSHQVEQQLGLNLLLRAAEAHNLNMRLNHVNEGDVFGKSLVQDADAALGRNWQP